MSSVGAAGRAPVTRVDVANLIDLRWQVLRQGRPRESAHMGGDDHPDARHWAYHDAEGRVCGCATVIPSPFPDGPGARWQLRGMAVDAALQGMGIGGEVLVTVQQDVAEPMWCNARVAAVPFYQAHGWQVVSDTFDVPDVGPHQRMVWSP